MSKLSTDRIIQIILLVIIAAGFVLVGFMMKPSTPAMGGQKPGGPPGAPVSGGKGNGETNRIAVVTETVELRTVSTFIRINGDVVSDVSIDIYPDAQGKLIERKVKLGSYVHKGDIIGVVDPSTPGQVYTISNVRSTITGTVTAVNAHVGDTVHTGTSIAVIGDLANLSIITYIPERFITNIKTGLSAQVSFEAFPGTEFEARVIQLNPVVDPASRSLETKLEMTDPDPRIRAGMFATIRLITQERQQVVAVPATAVTSYYEDKAVFVPKENGTVERRIVTTGLASDDLVEITSGLSRGEEVVIQGLSSLTDGTAVRIVKGVSTEE
ncbi:MAG: efflux RND transporter periplasmic adaptor subunit [Spirochaetales bacterium]|nr:efflux RND transporter periplasmic adaptor subunit [Spirochaetales bacterium]